MGDDSSEWPQDWGDIDRTTLARILASGLTPRQVGALYGRNRDAVHNLVRRWGLDSRALRARAIGLAVKHPDVAADFVKVVDGAPTHYGPGDLLAGSRARCRWRCATCGEEWVASVANRTKRGSGCPSCAQRRVVEKARAPPAKSPYLAEVSDNLIAEFRKNLSRPDRDILSTPSGSKDRILWRCRRGHEWETSAAQRASRLSQCPTCLAGLWTSRLEFQVAELVQLATGLQVRVGAPRHRTDRAATDHIDLLVVEPDLLCDLDPTGWHSDEKAVARDLRKLERLAGERYVRIRPQRLGRLPTHRALPEQQVVLWGPAEGDPWLWASGVVNALRAVWPTAELQTPSVEAHREALLRADEKWRRLRSGSRKRSLASEHPLIAKQFVAVVDRPDITAADLAPAGDDRALWRCPECGHEWVSTAREN